MKYQTIFMMVRVQVQTTLTQISDTVSEIEQHSVLQLSDTQNVKVLETEILLSRFPNPELIHRQTSKGNDQ